MSDTAGYVCLAVTAISAAAYPFFGFVVLLERQSDDCRRGEQGGLYEECQDHER